MIGYDMIWYDRIKCDMIWYDVIRTIMFLIMAWHTCYNHHIILEVKNVQWCLQACQHTRNGSVFHVYTAKTAGQGNWHPHVWDSFPSRFSKNSRWGRRVSRSCLQAWPFLGRSTIPLGKVEKGNTVIPYSPPCRTECFGCKDVGFFLVARGAFESFEDHPIKTSWKNFSISPTASKLSISNVIPRISSSYYIMFSKLNV